MCVFKSILYVEICNVSRTYHW